MFLNKPLMKLVNYVRGILEVKPKLVRDLEIHFVKLPSLQLVE